MVHAELRRGTLKKHFVPVARPGTKGFLLLSRHGIPGWETGTKKVSQPGQIKVCVVVNASIYFKNLIQQSMSLV